MDTKTVWTALFDRMTPQQIGDWYSQNKEASESFGSWATRKYAALYNQPVGEDIALELSHLFAETLTVWPDLDPLDYSIETEAGTVYPNYQLGNDLRRIGAVQAHTFGDCVDGFTAHAEELNAVLHKLQAAGVPFHFVCTLGGRLTDGLNAEFTEYTFQNAPSLETVAPRQLSVMCLYDKQVRELVRSHANQFLIATAQSEIASRFGMHSVKHSRYELSFLRRMMVAALSVNSSNSIAGTIRQLVKQYITDRFSVNVTEM